MQKVKKKLKQVINKLTLLDFLVILIFLSGLLLFFFFFRRQEIFINARFKVTDEDALYARTNPSVQYAYSFTPGDIEKNELGQTIAEIISVDSYDLNPTTRVAIVDLKLKVVYNPLKKQYTLDGKPIVFGSSFNFAFSQVSFKGMVVDFPGLTQKEVVEKRIVMAQNRWDSQYFSDTSGVPEYIANAVKIGDEAKNINGTTLVKVLDVTIQPAKRTVVTAAGDTKVIQDPLRKDVFYKLEVTTKRIGDEVFMFDYQKFGIGEQIPLNLPQITTFPTIIELK
jgi:hypothetical protein